MHDKNVVICILLLLSWTYMASCCPKMPAPLDPVSQVHWLSALLLEPSALVGISS